MMRMTFAFFVELQDFIFHGWNSSTAAGLIGAFMFCCLLSVSIEGLKLLKQYITNIAVINTHCDGQTRAHRIQYHAASTVAYFFHLIIGYILMLAVMSYNAWLFVAVVTGSTLGFFILGGRRSQLDNDLEMLAQSRSRSSLDTTERDRLSTSNSGDEIQE